MVKNVPPQLRASAHREIGSGHLAWVGESYWPFNVSKFKWFLRDQLPHTQGPALSSHTQQGWDVGVGSHS